MAESNLAPVMKPPLIDELREVLLHEYKTAKFFPFLPKDLQYKQTDLIK
jgi:hypothetical protein